MKKMIRRRGGVRSRLGMGVDGQIREGKGRKRRNRRKRARQMNNPEREHRDRDEEEKKRMGGKGGEG